MSFAVYFFDPRLSQGVFMYRAILLLTMVMSPTVFAQGFLLGSPKTDAPAPAKVVAPSTQLPSNAPTPAPRLNRDSPAILQQIEALANPPPPQEEKPPEEVKPPVNAQPSAVQMFPQCVCSEGRFCQDKATVEQIVVRTLGVSDVFTKTMTASAPDDPADPGKFVLAESSGIVMLKILGGIGARKPTLPALICVGDDNTILARLIIPFGDALDIGIRRQNSTSVRMQADSKAHEIKFDGSFSVR